MYCRSKKNAWIMFFATWPVTSVGEVAALDAARGVEVDLGALDGRVQDGARRGHRRALELLLQQGRERRQDARPTRGCDGVPPGIL